MKSCSPIVVAMAGIMAMSTPNMATSADTGTGDVASAVAQKHVPHPVPRFTIDLSHMGRSSYVLNLTFSPDDNYLAIADMPDMGSTSALIWDLRNNREVNRISGMPSLIKELVLIRA